MIIRTYVYQPGLLPAIDENGKKISGWVQCFTASAWNYLSWMTDNFFQFGDKIATLRYLTYILTGGRNEFDQETEIPSDHDAMFMYEKQLFAMNHYLHDIAFSDKRMNGFIGDGGSYDAVLQIAKKRPVIVGTYKIGGLPGGHVMILDHTGNNFNVMIDPAGDARTNYKIPSGYGVEYSDSMCREHFGRGGRIHALWME